MFVLLIVVLLYFSFVFVVGPSGRCLVSLYGCVLICFVLKCLVLFLDVLCCFILGPSGQCMYVVVFVPVLFSGVRGLLVYCYCLFWPRLLFTGRMAWGVFFINVLFLYCFTCCTCLFFVLFGQYCVCPVMFHAMPLDVCFVFLEVLFCVVTVIASLPLYSVLCFDVCCIFHVFLV